MSFTDQGDQDLSITFGQDVDAKLIGQRFDTVVPFGVYKGFDLTIISNSQVSVRPGIAHVGDGKGNTIRLETTKSVKVATDTSTEFIVIKWNYKAAEGWFGEIKAVGSISNQMVVLGKVLFDNNNNANTIDLRPRDIPYLEDTGLEVQDEAIFNGAVVEKTVEITSDSFSIGLQGRSFGVRTDKLSSSPTINLPTGVDLQSGRVIEVFDSGGDAGTHNIIIDSGSNESILGGDTHTISNNYGSVILHYFGGNNVWSVK